jgi:hypothetical protein
MMLYCAVDVIVKSSGDYSCPSGFTMYESFMPSMLDSELVIRAVMSGMFASLSIFGAVWGCKVLLKAIKNF